MTVSFSLDGPPDVNDAHRRDHAGRPSHARTVEGIRLVREWLPEALTGVLSVVDIASEPERVYHHLAELGAPVLDFNLPHATHECPPSRPAGLEAPAYGRWLARVFDAWAAGDKYRHSVRMFDHIIGLTVGVKNSVEYLGLAAVDLIVVESDGAIEGVDALKASFDGAPDLGLNIFDHDFDDALQHPAIARRQTGIGELAATCQACEHVHVCGGGYLPHRFSRASGFNNPSVYCDDLAFVIAHVQARVGAVHAVA